MPQNSQLDMCDDSSPHQQSSPEVPAGGFPTNESMSIGLGLALQGIDGSPEALGKRSLLQNGRLHPYLPTALSAAKSLIGTK